MARVELDPVSEAPSGTFRWRGERYAGPKTENVPYESIRLLDGSKYPDSGPNLPDSGAWPWIAAGSTEGPDVQCQAITQTHNDRCPKRAAVRLAVSDNETGALGAVSLCGGHWDVLKRGKSSGVTLIR
jgi:hypothetical protein